MQTNKTIISDIPKVGDTGSGVKALQQALLDVGFMPGTVDGIFGGKTKAAVSALQTSMGLPGSGIIGPKTLARLNLVVQPVSPATHMPASTKDLNGRKDRHLHPTFRLMLEAELCRMGGGAFPACFHEGNIPECVIAVSRAMLALDVHEVGGNNMGPKIGMIQSVTGARTEKGNGDAWCADTGQCVIAFIEDAFQIESPVPASAGVMNTLEGAQKIPGLVTHASEPGTLSCSQHGSGWQGHMWITVGVRADGIEETIEGNTDDGGSREGDALVARTRHPKTNGDLRKRGNVRIYPYNKLPEATA